jgi:hypothetical protein
MAAIGIGSRVLVATGEGAYRGDGVWAEMVRVVEGLPGGLYRVEDDDGLRWLIGREEIIRVE